MTTAAVRTLKASKLRIAVTNHDQQVSGMRIQPMPGARRLTVVVTKLIALMIVAKQKSAMLISQRSVPRAAPGAAAASALSGAYCVQPAPEGPPGTKNAAIRIKKDVRVVQKPAIFSRGKAISEAPSCNGRKKVPKPF